MTKINGQKWKNALISSVNSMINNKSRINALNVFPVPDGDTGSNMSSTIENASLEILNLQTNSIGEISAKFARGMLLSARGNSGVILSQIFKGISVAFEDKEEATGFDIVEAFAKAQEYSYKSVMKPIEGTILTVVRIIAENLSKNVTPSHTIIEIFKMIVAFARKAVDLTPELLPVLKEVGVKDSGGEGLYLILNGIYLSLIDKPVQLEDNLFQAKKNIMTQNFFDGPEDWSGEFGYCTEFIVELKSSKFFKDEKFKLALLKYGSSIIVVHDDNILKTHIHTLKPGNVFNFAQKYGEFLSLKSENMTLQANESNKVEREIIQNNINIQEKQQENTQDIMIQKEETIVISCNIGQGIINDMKNLGTKFVIEGGQSMNPSTSDFIQAINKVKYDNIIILPNNPNVILVVQQVAQTITDKKIIIVPTKTQMQGLVAMMNYNKSANLKENQEQMVDAMKSVLTGQVIKSSRTTKIQGVFVNKGEFLAIAENKILKSSSSKIDSAIAIAKKLIDEDTEIITIYYGEDSAETDAIEFASYLETHHEVQTEIKNGGQPLYNFLIAFE